MAVDLGGLGRSVLRPDVDLGRTVGSFTTVYPLALRCASGDELGPGAVGRAHEVAGAFTALRNRLADCHINVKCNPPRRSAVRPADIAFTYAGTHSRHVGVLSEEAPSS